MVKIALEFVGNVKTPAFRELASGPGWTVSDIVCSAGPKDRPFEEQHSCANVAIVVGGTFQYRSSAGALMTPIRASAPPTAMASALLAGSPRVSAEELSVRVAGQAAAIVRSPDRDTGLAAGALARVTRAVRAIDKDPSAPQNLNGLAAIAGLSPYHFLRAFEAAVGATPHQYLLRARLRRAAIRLKTGDEKALDCGFGDVSNFNRAFRAEFGMNPRRYRAESYQEVM